MSVRAYKLIEVKHAKEHTFVVDVFYPMVRRYIVGDYNEGGIMDLNVKKIRNDITLKKVTEIDIVKVLKQIIKESKGCDVISYYCF
jgi:hypothetical protein